MSLDFYLESTPRRCVCHVCGKPSKKPEELFWINITHNLGKMAKAAGIYEVLWHPNDKGQVKARNIIPTLRKGLEDLKSRKEYFETFNASNGWGTYEHFVPFVEKVLKACQENPRALVRVSI